jgi:predicted DCC family thiol-disulfide oxidoreductase YuxK
MSKDIFPEFLTLNADFSHAQLLLPRYHIPMPTTPVEPWIVLFDGECKLCNGSVAFILKHDRAGRFAFASSQSPAGQALMATHGFTGPTPGSIVLIHGEKCYVKTTATLEIARRLAWPWPVFYSLILIPRPLRDAVYGVIARNRRRWFGRAEQCVMIPPSRRADGARR